MQCIVFMLWWFSYQKHKYVFELFIRRMKCKPKFIDFQKSNSTWGIRGHDIIKYLNLITRYIILIKDYVSGSKGIIFRSLSQYQFLILKTSIKLKILFLKISWSYLFFPLLPTSTLESKTGIINSFQISFLSIFRSQRLWNIEKLSFIKLFASFINLYACVDMFLIIKRYVFIQSTLTIM